MIRKPLFLLLLWLLATPALAEDLLMARIPMTFPEAMLKLQNVLKAHGQTLSRVQRVDIGLTSKGYKTDKYRVVFFGRLDEIREVAEKHPLLIPYVPHKIAIFAEEDETLIVAANPASLFPEKDPALQKFVRTWKADLEAIFHDMREE